jgi:hypothetical protein
LFVDDKPLHSVGISSWRVFLVLCHLLGNLQMKGQPMTPEAKAAEEIERRQKCCCNCQHYQDACRYQCYAEEILKANAAHYLPLLRRWEPNTISMSDLGEIQQEIRRLESAKGDA